MAGALIDGDPRDVAVIDADAGVAATYAELHERVAAQAALLDKEDPGVAFLFASNSLGSVVDYLALRSLGTPTLLLDRAMPPDRLDELVQAYEPEIVLGLELTLDGYNTDSETGGQFNRRLGARSAETSVSILLPTSGSTGNPKFVQLTDANLNINAIDIAVSLDILGDDRGLQPLPLFYSYGLSILNSHLAVGATTVLTSSSPLRPEFWEIVADHSVSSMPGVPYSYAMFLRAGLFEREIGALRYMTQAGGKLDPDRVREVHAGLSERGKRFHVMYGQTEASPRMSVLPSDDVPEHAHTVGFALDHGEFTIGDAGDDGVGEVRYTGPNVMVGYAQKRADVGVESMEGSLSTGDLGFLDADGRLAITGRLKRIAKLFGNRVSLQDIELHFAFLGPVAAIEGENAIHVFHEHPDPDAVDATRTLERMLKVPPRTITLRAVDELPRGANGKIDYKALST